MESNFDPNELLPDDDETAKLSEFLSNPEIMTPISTPVVASAGELLVMMLKFALHFTLPFNGSCAIFRLINSIFEDPVFSDTKYMLDKLFNPKCNVEFHAVCPQCLKYLGRLENLCDKNESKCVDCNISLDVMNPSYPSFFAVIDPSEQIANCLSKNSEY